MASSNYVMASTLKKYSTFVLEYMLKNSTTPKLTKALIEAELKSRKN